jgi:hypothetical protein
LNNTVFIGGSRHISHLSDPVRERLDNVVKNGCPVVLGDANGADKAVQRYLAESGYRSVTVFCSGPHYRNNLGNWPTKNVMPTEGAKGFEFYAAKDRKMAEQADYGLMIWDGKSPGTVLNALRLVTANKSTVIFHEREKRTIVMRSMTDWEGFLSKCTPELISDIKERATPAERAKGLDPQREIAYETNHQNHANRSQAKPPSVRELTEAINSALVSADPTLLADAMIELAKKRKLPDVEQKATRLRSYLSSDKEKTEFHVILSAISSIGVRLPTANTSKGHRKKSSDAQTAPLAPQSSS